MFSALETSDKNLDWIDRDNYCLVRTQDEFQRLANAMESAPGQRSVDCETEGLSTLCHHIVGLSFSPRPGYAFYLPIRHRYFDNFPLTRCISQVQDLLRRYKWTTFNGGFDWKFIKADLDTEIDIEDDVQADMWLIDSDRGPMNQRKRLRLDHLSKELLSIEQLKLEDLLPEGVYDFSIVQDEEDALLYAGGDADCTLRVRAALDKKLRDYKLLELSRLEARTAVVAARMEFNGIYVDQAYARSLDLTPELDRIQQRIIELTGELVNPLSHDQVASLIFDKLKINPPNKDSRSVDEKVLTKLKDRHPVIPPILDYREVSKIKGSFLDKLVEVAAEDERLHGEFCSTGTRSGRFSSAGGVGRGGAKLKINGQQFPTPSDDSLVNIRKVLRASPDHYWVSCDFGQVEYRILAYVSKDKGLLEAYANNVDIHTKTASLILRVPVQSVDDKKRKRGKTLNFAISYGMTDAGLALTLGISIKEAAALRAAYFENIPGVDRLIRETKAFVSAKGYVLTEFGRRRNYDFTGLDAKRIEALLMSGFNTRIQGTAADINKMALVKLDPALQREFRNRHKTLSTIHDEVNNEFHKSIPIGVSARFMYDTMRFKAGLKPGWLDFPVDIAVGTNFGELYELPESEFDNVKTIDDVRQLKPVTKATDDTPAPRAHEPPPDKLRTVTIRPPAVVLHLPEGVTEDTVSALRETIDTHHGAYAVFVCQGASFFQCHGLTVNPSHSFTQAAAQLGVKLHVVKPSQPRTFDPASLSF